MDVGDLLSELTQRGVHDVSASTLDRALYSSDASLYRVVPQAVARPRHPDELIAILDVARTTGVPITMRGAGTSIAGNAVGPGLVVDTRRHLNRILAIDREARTAKVQPGVGHAQLQRAAAPHGLQFGPDPSSHSRCTIGGMIGNNACGSRALGYGRTSDNVLRLDVAYGNGEHTSASAGSATGRALAELAAGSLAHVRRNFGTFSRQVSGYALEHLLPERGTDVARFLVGSEGTLALVLDADVILVPEDRHRTLVVLGYPDMASAADAVPALLSGHGSRLVACEGLDSRIVDLVRGQGRRVPDLPCGRGWLFVEVAGGPDSTSVAAALGKEGQCLDSRLILDAGEVAALWRIREDGSGLAARSLSSPAHAGWEDAAVPPNRLGAWLREFEELLRLHRLEGIPYGHFGDGCVHVRINFGFGAGDSSLQDFVTAAAERLKEFGGSLSGEHGDGRARSELLPIMYDSASMDLFARAKAICDPGNLLNPGVIVRPAPLSADLRPARPRTDLASRLRFTHDEGSFAGAVHRCTGVGRCVTVEGSGQMCPSYEATREEKDSTRGRARVLQEALDGSLVRGVGDPAVHDALDLCLACKGCSSECPTGVDMATYKSEVLAQRYRGRLRPRSHYTLGRLPQVAPVLSRFAALANRTLRWSPVQGAVKSAAGIDSRRSLPGLAPRSLSRSVRRARSFSLEADRPDVWLWGDTFTEYFLPESGLATMRVLEAAGLRVGLVRQRACCGLTLVTTGQLDRARRTVTEAIRVLEPYVASGVPVVGVEPSCLATLRSDALELADDRRAAHVASGLLTVAELMSRLDWEPPSLSGVTVVAQPHCHHASVIGWDADEALLERAGARVVRVSGCCGLAGNFGMEIGHYEVSKAVAETNLLPTLRRHPDAVVLADGMSCRHQLKDLAGVATLHLSELLASRLDDDLS